MRNPFRYFKTSPEVIRLAVMMYACYPLSLRQIEDLLCERGIEAKFRGAKSLQKFASIHSSVHNHFYQERHLYSRENFKNNRSPALTEWHQLAA